MNRFIHTNFAFSLVFFLIAAVTSVLGAMGYFADQMASSGFAWLSLGISSLTAALGFGSLIGAYAKAVVRQGAGHG